MKFFPQARYITCCVITFLLVLLRNIVLAQADKFEPGYIITLQGDSVTGLVQINDVPVLPGTFTFKEAQGSGLKTYSSNEIKAYGIGTQKRYVAYSIQSGGTNDKVFLSNLVRGKVSLFYFDDRYFIDAGNGIQELTTSTTNVTRDSKVYSQELPVYKGVLQKEMNDCSTIHEKLKGTSLKTSDLIKLFKEYHTCIDQPATIYESGAGKIKVVVGLALTGQSTGLDIKSGGNASYIYLDNNDPMKDFTLAPTFIVEFYAPEGRGRFRIRTGVSYFMGNYHLYDQGSPGTLDHELTIDMARIELPVMIKYYPIRNAGLYVAAGLGFNVSVKWEPKSATIVPPSTVISETGDLKNNSFFTNPMAGIGYDFPIGRRKLFIEGIFGQSKSVLASSQNPTSKLNSITFTTGIVF
jgi:hypothetical protein